MAFTFAELLPAFGDVALEAMELELALLKPDEAALPPTRDWYTAGATPRYGL